MQLKALSYLREVVEAGSFARAATHRYKEQVAVSAWQRGPVGGISCLESSARRKRANCATSPIRRFRASNVGAAAAHSIMLAARMRGSRFSVAIRDRYGPLTCIQVCPELAI